VSFFSKALVWSVCLGASLIAELIGSQSAFGQTPMSVLDDWKREVILSESPKRVISLSAHLTQLAVEAGMADMLIGTDLHSDISLIKSPRAAALVKLAAYPQPSIEAIANLKPDLVFLWGAGLSVSTVNALQNLGIKVFVSQPKRLADIPTTLVAMGKLAGTSNSKLVRNRVNDLSAKIAKAEVFRRGYDVLLPVFVQVWQQPLMTVGRLSVMAQALELCGAQLLLAPNNDGSAQINPEAVINAGPKVIVATDIDAARSYWESKRVTSWRYLSLPSSALSQPSPQLIDSLKVLCERLESAR
jgi:iron complex transport system substrate-binding protein